MVKLQRKTRGWLIQNSRQRRLLGGEKERNVIKEHTGES